MFYIQVSGSSPVEFDPEFDVKEEDTRTRFKHRTRGGKSFSYDFGEKKRFKMGVRFVDSSFAAKVNSAWSNNTNLFFSTGSDDLVYLMRLANRQKPIRQYIEPHREYFAGSLELESYMSTGNTCVFYSYPSGDYGSVSSASTSSYDYGAVNAAVTNCPIDFGGLF